MTPKPDRTTLPLPYAHALFRALYVGDPIPLDLVSDPALSSCATISIPDALFMRCLRAAYAPDPPPLRDAPYEGADPDSDEPVTPAQPPTTISPVGSTYEPIGLALTRRRAAAPEDASDARNPEPASD